MDKTELTHTIDFLTKVPFFSEVSKNSLSHLCENLSARTYRKNETIFAKDEPGEAMYVLLSGKVKVHEQDHVFG